MKENTIVRTEGKLLRVLKIKENEVFVIDCNKLNMPYWTHIAEYELLTEEELIKTNPLADRNIDKIPVKDQAVMHTRFSIVSPLLPVIEDDIKRNDTLHMVSELYNVSIATIKRWLCIYLAFNNMVVLAPAGKNKKKELSEEQKVFRKFINKYYYTRQKQKLTAVYNYMLKEVYTDSGGKLKENYPPFSRFKYFFYTFNKKQTECIITNGS